MNPVLARELKERMRGLRAFVAVMLFVGLLTCTVWLVYEANQTLDPFDVDLERQTRIGRDLFEWVLAIMLGLICFLVPGLTAGAVAGERERQTLLPLQITLLRPRQILWGKVTAALAFLTLLVVAALPIMAVAYQLGGVAVLDIVRGLGALLAVGVLLAAMVVGLSAFARRVQSATLLAYGFTFVLLTGSFLLTAGWAVVDASRGNDRGDPPAILLTPNPLVFVADATAGRNIDVGSSPFRPLRELSASLYDERGGWIGASRSPDDVSFGEPSGAFVVFDGDDRTERHGFPAWVLSLAAMSALAGGLFVLGARRLRIPTEVER